VHDAGIHPINKRLLPDTWFTNRWSYFVSSLAVYYFFFSPMAMAFNEITWAEDWWQVDAFMTLVWNIRGTFWGHLGNIQGTFGEHSVDVQ
jgi:hypothetical protein